MLSNLIQNYSIEAIALWSSVLLLLSIFGSKAASRFGVPAVLFFLFMGMMIGSDGPGGVPFDDPLVAQFLGIFALAYIIFSGALNTSKENIKPVFWAGISLSTSAVIITATTVAVVALIIFKVSPIEAFLLGAIVSATDVAAVFSVLRARKITLNRNLKSLLEFESGSNDPMAVILTLSIMHLMIHPSKFWFTLVGGLLGKFIMGTIIGYLIGKLAVYLINKLKLEYEGLYPVLTFALVLFIYSLTEYAGGSGFLAVYVAGLIIGNSDIARKTSLVNFHDGLAWLMQIIVFLIFGLLIFPLQLVPIIWPGLIIAFSLMFVARPAGVYLALLFSRIPYREKTVIAWVGLRGATPLVLATFPLIKKLPNADILFNVVFFVVVVSIFIQAPLIPFFTRKLIK